MSYVLVILFAILAYTIYSFHSDLKRWAYINYGANINNGIFAEGIAIFMMMIGYDYNSNITVTLMLAGLALFIGWFIYNVFEYKIGGLLLFFAELIYALLFVFIFVFIICTILGRKRR